MIGIYKMLSEETQNGPRILLETVWHHFNGGIVKCCELMGAKSGDIAQWGDY